MSLDALKVKRSLWVSCFAMEERNSLLQQAFQMVWNAAVFRMINESRKLTLDNDQGQKEISGTIHYFIDECFFDSQLLAIRRLIDGYELEGKKGVFSLLSLIKDMQANITLMTRENLFLAEGRVYDYEEIDRQAWEYRSKLLGKGVYSLPKELDSYPSKFRHAQIDLLCGVNEKQRQPSNCIREGIFDHLINRLKIATAQIKTYVDKNIAHAATLESRNYHDADEVSITLGHLWEAHKVICQTISFVNSHILSEGNGGFLATPQYDHLKLIEKSLVPKECVDALSQQWYDFGKEASSWAQWGIEELQQEMSDCCRTS